MRLKYMYNWKQKDFNILNKEDKSIYYLTEKKRIEIRANRE